MKRKTFLWLAILLLLLAVACALVALRMGPGSEDAVPIMVKLGLQRPDPSEAIAALTVPEPLTQPETEGGKRILSALQAVCALTPEGECRVEGDEAVQMFRLTRLDTAALRADLIAALTARLQNWVDAAARGSEVYTDEQAIRPELLEPAFLEELDAALNASRYPEELNLELALHYEDGVWVPNEMNLTQMLYLLQMGNPDAMAGSLFALTSEALPSLPVRYRIAEDALAGPVPNPDCFGETDDPAVIEALLQRPEAQTLIGGQTLCWNAGLERFPGSSIQYYLDETILALCWQEVEARGVGTFSEVFVADGSQLRRKIAGDAPFDLHFETCSQFALDTNAVLAVGGDFYHHGRACGISVYQREICRFEPETCDVCYITADGDMLFSYRGQFTSEDEARQFIADNDVLFSLVFGPVLIDDGVDVTPASYAWGEIDDDYDRSAIGLLGRHHYLTMNINCGQGQYYYLATLRQAADAMIRRGCVKAYTLDGGQTATTVFGGRLINPVQFGWEKEISDVIYFATALPNE